MTEQIEVKGIGQPILKQELKGKFEEMFKESKREINEAHSGHININYKPQSFNIPITPELENNPLFSTLIEWMNEFQKEIHERAAGQEAENIHLKMILYKCLNRLLRVIVLTKDSNTQEGYIRRVYNWFSKRKMKAKPRSRKELGISSAWQSTEPEKPPAMNENKTLYEEKRRTVHPEISPPKNRLLEYNTKELLLTKIQEPYDQDKRETAATLLPTLSTLIEKPREHKQSGNGSHFLYYKPRYFEEQKMERLWLAKKNKNVAKKREEVEHKKAVAKWGLARSRFNENLLRKHENKNYANNFAVRKQETKAVRSKTVDKVHYAKIYNEESSDDEERVAKKRYNKNNKKPPEVIDTSQPTKSMAIEKKGLGSKKKSLKVVKSIVPKVATIIADSGKKRVDYVRKMFGHLINEVNDNMESAANIFVNGPKGINSLSIYNKDVRRPYTVNSSMIVSNNLPITHQGEREQFRMSQIKEINGIKKYLAKEEITCNATSLQRAILMPEDHSELRMTAENFLHPGSRLLVDPFAVVKKKAKKKKGKKN